ncbi:MAG: hypothetical protein K2X86_09640 [Cytophagaceae bacterium]|nr:hypothetical protein [Cytophagaceae bacterium]
MKILFVLFFISFNSFAQPEVRAKLLTDSLDGKLNLTEAQKKKITEINTNTCKWLDQVYQNNTIAIEHSTNLEKRLKEIETKWNKSVKKVIGKRKLKRCWEKNKKEDAEKNADAFRINKKYLGFDYLLPHKY